MDCPVLETDPYGSEFIKQFNQKALKLHIPLSGSLAITHRCNLRCKHCYLGCHEKESTKGEMDEEMILRLLDDVAEAGCLNLLITGGEPMLRQDFPDIYRRARSNGLIVTVFTNGTLVSDTCLDVFAMFTPNIVEITLYAAKEKTYENITGVKGSFKRCLQGIERLLANKIPLRLKTVVMTLNYHEFPAIKKIAKDYGVKFRFDPMINACLNGAKNPMSLRIKPEEIIALDIAEEERLSDWQQFYKRYRDIPISEKLYNCGAGLCNFHIDANGNLLPCLMSVKYPYDLNKGSFAEGWNDFIPRIREKKASDDFICNKCEDRLLCNFCPPFFFLENGDEEKRSEFCCAVAKARATLIKKMCKQS